MSGRPPAPREYLAGLPGYVAGSAARGSDGVPGAKLSSNESPYPLPRAMVDAMALAAAQANRYPLDGGVLTARLAARHSVPEEMVIVAGGSLELLRDLLAAYAGFDSEVVFGWRSYEAYPILVQSAGARPVPVPLNDWRLDLAGVLAAVTPRTRLVLLANPNNPTGTASRPADLERFATELPERCLLVLDEAYCEYGERDLGPQGIALALNRPNLVVLRTFSKAYGLAGTRVGWGVAHPLVVQTLKQIALPFTLTAVAQAGALAALDHETALFAQVEETVSERARVAGSLRTAGYTVPHSEANFLWLPLGTGSQAFAEAVGTAGISVRCFPGDGVRVTIGTPAENSRLLDAAWSLRAQTRDRGGG
ncbi:MAG TPA: histidinol-phosphate transaminase [Candidatus Dormibacteraeota bacterium]